MTNEDPTPETAQRSWRAAVGGMWDEIGQLQFRYMVSRGLRPEHRLLDAGCGSLRGGIHFIRYLSNGHYYGIDKDDSLLEAGRNNELSRAGLAEREVTLLCRDDFRFTEFGVQFDFAMAQSVFTHLAWNPILRCLVEMKSVLAPKGEFYATFFEDPNGSHKTTSMQHSPGGIVTYPDKDPYHYEFSMFEDLAQRAGLVNEYIGNWEHPRAQRLMVFRHGCSTPANSARVRAG